MNVIGAVWYKHILSAIYNESLKTKFYLRPLAPFRYADAAALFICNRKVLGSNVGQDTDILSDGHRVFPHVLQTNVRVVTLIDQDSFHISSHSLLIVIQAFDAIHTEFTGSVLQ